MCDPEFEEDCILPIVQKTLLKPGDCASVYKVKLHNRYNHLFGQVCDRIFMMDSTLQPIVADVA